MGRLDRESALDPVAGSGVAAAYALLIFFWARSLARVVADARFPVLPRVAWAVAGCGLTAGVLDEVENYALLRMLYGPASDWLAALSWWCAGVKFGLLIVAGVGLAVLVGAVLCVPARTGAKL
jgi:hypothetical protein